MRLQNDSAHEYRERQDYDDEQEMRNFDTTQLERHVNIAFHFSPGATDSDNIWR